MKTKCILALCALSAVSAQAAISMVGTPQTSTTAISATAATYATFTGVQPGDWVVVASATNRDNTYTIGMTNAGTATMDAVTSINASALAPTQNSWIQYAAVSSVAGGDTLTIQLAKTTGGGTNISAAVALYLLRPGAGETISLAGFDADFAATGVGNSITLDASFTPSLTSAFGVIATSTSAGTTNTFDAISGWTTNLTGNGIRRDLSNAGITGSSVSVTYGTTEDLALSGAMAVFTAVPEPSAALLGGLGLLGLLRRRR